MSSRDNVRRINFKLFKLEALKKEIETEVLIERGDMALFEMMRQEFKERKKTGGRRFIVMMEPDPGQQDARQEQKSTKVSESDGDYL